ncbi:MAG: carboxypeptidase-like regulatory domain-containing protein [Polyangiaceae bacterium]|nr:carboxypeptidase-like regulatory domain-containing protein [Polyangiaceae bacterium]
MREARAMVKAAFVMTCAALFGCTPVQGTPQKRPSTNACSTEQECSAYAPSETSSLSPTCNEGRCEFVADAPSFDFTIVINMPSTASYAAGQTFAIPSSTLFKRSNAGPTSTCPVTSCLPLPNFGDASGSYTVTSDAAAIVGVALSASTSFPVRAVYTPLFGADDARASDLGLPLDSIVSTSRLVPVDGATPALLYQTSLPSASYQRVLYPEAPYNEDFPPVFNTVRFGTQFPDAFTLGAPLESFTQLDDPTGNTRTATISRSDGLEGWHVWLADEPTMARISSLRTLHGVASTVRLDTIGQSQPDTPALRDKVNIVVAPPDDWAGVPRFVSPLIGGAGRNVVYPTLPSPTSLIGLVAQLTEAGYMGIAAELSFASESIRLVDGSLQPLLEYKTSLSTDDSGRFVTVLPPGIYDITIQPAEGTGFSTVQETSVDVEPGAALTLTPIKRTLVSGHAISSDGRPLAQAAVLADPSRDGQGVLPRPARTSTLDDGSFQMELDQGRYNISVEPQAATGFPRFVTIREIGGDASEDDAQDLGTLTVPLPMRLSFTVKGPVSKAANYVPIGGAIVRIFAVPVSGSQAVEIGMAMTDSNGLCEIPLADQPH